MNTRITRAITARRWVWTALDNGAPRELLTPLMRHADRLSNALTFPEFSHYSHAMRCAGGLDQAASG